MVGTALLVLVTAEAEGAISFWHGFSPEHWEALKPLVQQFGSKSGVRVEGRKMPWSELKDRLVASSATGDAPDVILLPTGGLEAVEDLLLDLTPLVRRDRVLDLPDFLPAALWAWRVKGRLCALPWSIDVPVFWYNPELVQAAGLSAPKDNWDWHSWLDYAEKMTVDHDGDGRRDQYGWLEWFTHTFLAVVWANDGDFLVNGQPAWRTANVREALEFYAEFYPPRRNVTLLWDELAHVGIDPAQMIYPPEAFAQKRVGMLAAGIWFADTYLVDAGSREYQASWAVAAWPKSPKGKQASLLEGQGLAIAAGSRDHNSAYKFVRWMLGKKEQLLVASLGQIPARSSALSGDVLLRHWPAAARRAVMETCQYARPMAPDVSRSYLLGSNQPLCTWVYSFLYGRTSLEGCLAQLDRFVPPLLSKGIR